jgi:hypothetical protein
MTRSFIAKYVSPWALRRDKVEQQRVAELRRRDGDDCRRCRRPMRFDLPRGHDKGPKVERIASLADGTADTLENFCLCHSRCNAVGSDHTDEVTERIRRKSEAALFAKSRAQRRRKQA